MLQDKTKMDLSVVKAGWATGLGVGVLPATLNHATSQRNAHFLLTALLREKQMV